MSKKKTDVKLIILSFLLSFLLLVVGLYELWKGYLVVFLNPSRRLYIYPIGTGIILILISSVSIYGLYKRKLFLYSAFLKSVTNILKFRINNLRKLIIFIILVYIFISLIYINIKY